MKTSVMKLSEKQIFEIKDLVNKGYTDPEIAKQFGTVTAGTIYYWRKKLGIKTTFTYEKISKISHDKLKELFNKGLSDYAIAKELGIKPCSVFSYRKYHNITRERNLKYNQPLPITKFHEELLIGTLMGDASLRKTNVNPSLICMHGIKQKEYCEYKANLLESLGSKVSCHKRKSIDKRTGLLYEDCTFSLPANPELLNLYNSFYPKSKKVLPVDLLTRYTEVSLAFHYMDDGNKMKNGYALATESFNRESLKIFCDFLFKKFGLIAKIWKNNSIYIVKKSSKKFRSLIEPYFCNSMKYKL